jgi:hypothetical protein
MMMTVVTGALMFPRLVAWSHPHRAYQWKQLQLGEDGSDAVLLLVQSSPARRHARRVERAGVFAIPAMLTNAL